jgi:hypothetical protein
MRLFLILIITGIIGIIAVLIMRLPLKNSMASLVMPGPLTAAHAKYENECAKCHHAFKKGSQNDLCVSCHKEVEEDLKNHQGLHGGSGLLKDKQCQTCHTDHKGREFNITPLDKETFNHAQTDFALVGAHARASVTCEACHAQGKKYRAAPKDCVNCHTNNDIHKGQSGTNCVACHKVTFWKDTYFDHKKTRFPLEEKHQQVTCNACHVDAAYKNTPIDCNACHLINDIHANTQGRQCGQCHSASGWKKISYDHNQKTKFILKDRHAELKCDSCHPKNLFDKKDPRSACLECHTGDDVHKGKNGAKCESCHSAVNWKQITFDHSRDTKYKLSGRHTGIQCAACHKDKSGNMKIDTSCYSCHKKEDTHKGQQGIMCELCHNENGWKEEVKFDHDLTNFPLIGLHAVTLCGECHVSAAFKDAGTDCLSCHQQDDFHKRTLGTDCAKCHNPNGWKLWEFDHNTQTTYTLNGAHEGLECRSCHQRPMGKDVLLSNSCVSCHDDDDTHQGRFGQECDRCHTTKSFKKMLWEDT